MSNLSEVTRCALHRLLEDPSVKASVQGTSTARVVGMTDGWATTEVTSRRFVITLEIPSPTRSES